MHCPSGAPRARRRLTVMVALLGLTTLTASNVSAAANAHKHHQFCYPRGASTITKNTKVRVYSIASKTRSRDVWACFRRNGKRYWLGPRDLEDLGGYYVSPILLSGVKVGWAGWWYDHYGDAGYSITVRN